MNQGGDKNGISRRGLAYERGPVGISRVIIPVNQDREEYIQHCYQCGTVSTLSRNNLDIVHDVRVDINVMRSISFPDNSEKLGSTVVWVNLPIYNKPVVVGILHNSDEMGTQIEENEFSFSKWIEGGQVSISGKAKGGQIDIVAQSNSSTGGRLSINVSNRGGTAKFDVTINGDFFLTASNGNVKFKDSFNLSITDGKADTKKTFIEASNSQIESRIQEGTSGYKYTEKAFEIGSADEAAPLGESLESFIHSLIDVIASQTVVTSMGPQPLVNAAGITAMKSKTIEWLSTYLKIQ